MGTDRDLTHDIENNKQDINRWSFEASIHYNLCQPPQEDESRLKAHNEQNEPNGMESTSLNTISRSGKSGKSETKILSIRVWDGLYSNLTLSYPNRVRF